MNSLLSSFKFMRTTVFSGLLLVSILLSSFAYGQVADSGRATISNQQEIVYLDKLTQFAKNMNFMIDRVIIPKLMESHRSCPQGLCAEVLKEIERFRTNFSSQIAKIREEYRVNFLTEVAQRNRARVLTRLEYTMTSAMQAFLYKSRSALKRRWFFKNRNLRSFTRRLTKINEHLEANEYVPLGMAIDLANLSPVPFGIFYGAWEYIKARFLYNRTITDIAERIRPGGYLPNNDQVQYRGWNADGELKFPEDSVVIVAINHDAGALDGMLALAINKRNGVENNLFLTTTVAYPALTAIFDHQDPDVFFRESRMWPRAMIRKIEESDEAVGFFTGPEGTLSTPGVQAPLVAKRGTFWMARQLARRIDKKVYIVHAMTNALDYFTDPATTDFVVNIFEPELVPSGPITRPRDSWSEEQRFLFENRANRARATRLIDVNARESIEGLAIPKVVNHSQQYACEYGFYRIN